MERIEEADEMLEMAKVAISLHPNLRFMGGLVHSMHHRIATPEEALVFTTAATDGFTCIYNPDFLIDNPSFIPMFTVLHETGHPMFLHWERQGTREPSLWNISGDEEINHTYQRAGIKVPEWAYCTPKYSDMSAEDIYQDYQQKPPETPTGATGTGDDMAPIGSLTQGKEGATEEDLKQHVEAILTREVTRSEIAGYASQVPGHIVDVVERLRNPVIPWTQVVKKFISVLKRGGKTYKSFNKRYFPTYYFPARKSQTVDRVLIAHDCSGSIGKIQHRADLTEMFFLVKTAKPKKVEYLQWGSAVVHTQSIKRYADLAKVDLHNAGGTEPKVVFDWINKEKRKYDLVIIFTDGYFSQSELKEPSYPVLWIVMSNPEFTAPFGKTVHYTKKES